MAKSFVTPRSSLYSQLFAISCFLSSSVAKLNDNHGLWSGSSGFVLVALLLPFGLRKHFKHSRTVACLLLLAFYGAGCGASKTYNSNVAAAGSYTVNVTASSVGGPAAKSLALNVTIVR